jgi:disulfide bond formation protein DsbB
MRSTDLAISFFTFLTVLANLATVGIIGLALAARWSRDGPIPRLWSAVRAELAAGGLGLAWLVAAVATGGSLWFSEVAGFEPCRLCWIQRACMYPLTMILAVAALARRPAAIAVATRPSSAPSRAPSLRAAHASGLAMVPAGIGALVAIYHVLIERFPSLESGTCDPRVPCTVVWFERLGFITLPYMALSGFVLILTLLGTSHLRPQEYAQ